MFFAAIYCSNFSKKFRLRLVTDTAESSTVLTLTTSIRSYITDADKHYEYVITSGGL